MSISSALKVAGFAAVLWLLGQDKTPIRGVVPAGEGFTLEQVLAPKAAGALLVVLDFVLRRSPLGPPLRRKLLNDNELRIVRELAAQIDMPPLHHPMHRRGPPADAAADAADEAAYGAAALLRRAADDSAGATTAPGGYRSVMDFASAYRGGTASPPAVVRAVLAGAADLEARGLRVFSELAPAAELERAAAASAARHAAGESLSVFDGVPVAVKDMICVLGLRRWNGRAPNDRASPCDDDDLIVARLRAAGALVVGVTVMVEIGVTPLGYNAHWGGPVNAHDPSRYSGGSSSGSAAAVAAGLVPVAIAFDGGGSIRVPAAWSGVVGLATTFGRVPFDGPDLKSTMIKAGPIAASVHDAALALAVIGASPYPHNHYYATLHGGSAGPPPPRFERFGELASLEGLTIGVVAPWYSRAEPAVAESCDAALARLAARGAAVDRSLALPHLRAMHLAHAIKISSEFALSLDGALSPALSSPGAAGPPLEAGTAVQAALGASMSATEALAAETVRAWAANATLSLFAGGVDAIALPTVNRPAAPLSAAARVRGESDVALIAEVSSSIFLANLVGLPAISVPVSHARAEGAAAPLPVGLQLIGAPWSEGALLRLAQAVERDVPAGSRPRPAELFVDVLARS